MSTCLCCRQLTQEPRGHDLCLGATLRHYSHELEIVARHQFGSYAVQQRGDLVYVHGIDQYRGLDVETMLTERLVDTSSSGTSPAMLAVDSQSRLYGLRPVTFQYDIHRYTAAGERDLSYGTDNHAAEYSRLVVRSDDSLIVQAYGDLGKICILDQDGTKLHGTDDPGFVTPELVFPVSVDIALAPDDGVLASWRSGDSSEESRNVAVTRYDAALGHVWTTFITSTTRQWPTIFDAGFGLITAAPNGRSYITVEDRLTALDDDGSIAWTVEIDGEPITLNATSEGVWVTWLATEPEELAQLYRLGFFDAAGELVKSRPIPDIPDVGKYCSTLHQEDESLWIVGSLTPFVLGRTRNNTQGF